MAAGRAGGTAPAVFNAANEVAVAAFLEGAIPFGPDQRDHRAGARRAHACSRHARWKRCARPIAGRGPAAQRVCEVIVLLTVLALIVVLGVLDLRARGGTLRRRQVGRDLRPPFLPRPRVADPVAHLPARGDRVLDLLAAARRLREDGEPGRGHRRAARSRAARHRVPVPPDRVFEAKPVWKRMIVILAGVTMNALFAWLVFSFLASKNGRQIDPGDHGRPRRGRDDTARRPKAFRNIRPGVGSWRSTARP